ncbi:MAG: ABC transporter ATP-binding protein [Nocardioidaceae bacterium]|nr:MAG: ABC transporter ATP-binding protein [Nocardioidaceae bacterium]
MGASIEVRDLTKRYDDLVAVDGVSFDVAPGEFFGLLGPNGAGKTTALEMIEGLREPDVGTVRIDGLDPRKRAPELQRRIGVQLQSSAFFERLTAREQLVTFASLYGVGADRADALLEQVGLVDKAASPVEKLSGGQAQRLSIACALVHDPEVVFLDEPTAALDPQARRNLWDFLKGLNDSGRTVVLTTHYMEEAEALCDRVAIIDRGQLLELDAPAALVRGLDAPTRISLAPGAIDAGMAAAIAGVDEVIDDPDALRLSTREPAAVLTELAARDALHGLSVQGATLEDVFLKRTGREYRS